MKRPLISRTWSLLHAQVSPLQAEYHIDGLKSSLCLEHVTILSSMEVREVLGLGKLPEWGRQAEQSVTALRINQG
jgi:hypothetical protein